MSYVIDQKHQSENTGRRIRHLVLHYTERDFAESLRLLTQEKVSVHYLLPQQPGKVYSLVDESLSAFHAGESYWQGRTHLNDTSIGIEMVHLGFEEGQNGRRWLAYPEQQIKTLIDLAKDISARYQIHPTCVVGHSDVAPQRKIDPGPLFPWKTLAEQGVGVWYDEATVAMRQNDFDNNNIDIYWLQTHLKKYGYSVEQTAQRDEQTKNVVRAFQMHFRPQDYSGIADSQTCAILADLIERCCS